jgi:hypothetical protein
LIALSQSLLFASLRQGYVLGEQSMFRRQVAPIWNDPFLATTVAVIAVSLLLVSGWLLRRRSRQGRGAAAVCLIVSTILHLVLVLVLPHLKMFGGGSGNRQSPDDAVGDADVVYATFDPAAPLASTATEDAHALMQPLPLPSVSATEQQPELERQHAADRQNDPQREPTELPQSLRAVAEAEKEADSSIAEDLLASWLNDEPDVEPAAARASADDQAFDDTPPEQSPSSSAAAASEPMPANVPGTTVSDFANRVGQSKRLALLQTGGDESTEAAVEAALRFLAADQRPDGSWDPSTSGAGRETLTLGTDRKGAGRRATTGITGLALLSMLGAGNTHQQGPFADNVRRGLTYLILHQKPDGSLAGEADVYESNYCHGMAAMAMCEAAAMTGDASAVDSAAAAVAYTMATQHPVTGGWRYVRGDPGDLSQLGWQAMVLDAGRLAGVPTTERSFVLTGRFLRSVRGGHQGGLAAYRPGEGPTRTMTAEALATRLLLGEQVPQNELREAEDYLLRQLPGVGRDNYYGWYYTSLALHQLQDDAWQTWNTAMKKHLLARQSASGSWPTDSEWGGYGGRIYTTAMGALCLEVYYRHLRRSTAVAAARDGKR